MELADAIGFIRDAVGSTGGVWADLGAGDGTFTAALADILGPGATIVAVDRDPAALEALDHLARADTDRATILPAHGDLAELGTIPELRGLVLDGAFFGNALHYLRDPGGALADVSERLGEGGRVIVVEYERETANSWVPHPLPVARLEVAARTAGLSSPEILARRPSQYQGEMYCALMRVRESRSRNRAAAASRRAASDRTLLVTDPAPDAARRLTDLARAWDVRVRATAATTTSLIARGEWRELPVVLKVVRAPGDEWHAGAVAAAFDGHGMVRVHRHAPGAALLEELRPGTPLAGLGDDDRATEILAEVLVHMLEASPEPAAAPTAEALGEAFGRYVASGDRQIAAALVQDAHGRWTELCRTQRDTRLLHGDLQHHNVLRDDERGWLAIDPKGVIAEPEYELGAALRNPSGVRWWANATAVGRRLDRFVSLLDLDRDRILAWTYAQAILSAIWTLEDGGTILDDDPRLALAAAIRPLLG